MTSRGIRLASIAAFLLVGVGGYFFYSVFAAQGRPGTPLAQAPLNAQQQVPPAFIMAVDDSGSMDSEILVPTNDGAVWWNTTNRSFFGLDRNNNSSPGLLNFNQSGNADATWKKYIYLFPFGHTGADGDGRVYTDAAHDHYALPPISTYGWARSPDVNMAYFDPTETYQPWVGHDGRPLQSVDDIDPVTGQSAPGRAPADPMRGDRRLDLTADFTFTGANQRFMFYGEMVIPQGTRYASVTCSDGGAVANQSSDPQEGGFRIASQNRPVTRTGANSRCGVGIRYFPATFYILETRAAAVAGEIGYLPSAIVNDGAATPNGAPLRRFEIRPSNFESGRYQETIDNFANWFTYYRKRHLGVRAGLSLAFNDQHLRIRAGYFKINDRNTVAMRRMNDPVGREQLYNSFLNHSGAGGTPNKEAVFHIGRQFERAYQRDVSPVQLSCQRNYGMLFTDGFSNVWTGAGVGNVDGAAANASVFHTSLRDGQSNTMADIAARFYLGLTVSGLPNDGPVPVAPSCSSASPNPRDDCQSNPHMNLYGVTLGAQGLIYGRPEHQAEMNDPFANPPAWPTQFFNRHPSAVDDLWHATLNSRGRFINASTPAALVRAMELVIRDVSTGQSPSGSVAVSGARIGVGSLAVTPRYDGTDWSGTLSADRVSINESTREAVFDTIWEASTRMPSHSERNVLFASGTDVLRFSPITSSSDLALADLCTNSLAFCSPADIALLGVDRDQSINYLLGQRDLELSRGAGQLRDRSSPLGDIVNSTPVVSAPTDDYGYRFLGENQSGVNLGAGYADYLTLKRAAAEARRYMVYVGANDGMLHAFDGGMTAAMAQDNTYDSAGGREKFGYIPATALGHMGNLLFPQTELAQEPPLFRHRYYVDGPVTVSDAYFTGGYSNGWSTVLVGTSGAGGRSVFALDVSRASRQVGSFSASDRLWEISDLDTSLNEDVRRNIGHVLGRPVIVPVKDDSGDVSWKAIFGNGYNSQNGRAVLFLVDIGTGSPTIRMIEAVESGSGVPAGPNGLGNIVAVDRWREGPGGALNVAGRDGFADTVYAGDQKGALWKFDLRNSTTSSVSVPLFVTLADSSGHRQPIIGGITATAGPVGGTMLYFGTGSFSFEGDQFGVSTQSLYAVNDVAQGQPTARLTRSNLNGQIASGTTSVRTLEAGAGATATVHGWYIDLRPGERFVGYPSIAAGVVFLPTYLPDQNTSPCAVGGANWIFGLNARTGAAALSNVYSEPGGDALFGSGTAAVELVDQGTGDSISSPIRDVAVQVVPRLGTGGEPDDPTDPGAPPDPPDGSTCWMLVSAPGAAPMYRPYPCGRQSWRQIQ